MDYRKIISFGKGGYVISVPKDWIEENGLKKGVPILVEKNGPSLILSSSENYDFKQDEQPHTEINIDNMDINKMTRTIISAYLDSYNTITIYGKNLKDVLPAVKNQVKELMALEIIESLKNKIVLKDFLDFNSVSIEKIFRRLDMLLRSMYSELKERNPQLYDNILDRDRSVNQHFYFILKILKKASLNPSLNKTLDLNYNKGIFYWSISFLLEDIGDEIKRLISTLKTAKFNQPTEDKIFELFSEIEQSYLTAMKIFYKKDANLALEEYDKNKEIIKKYDHIYQSNPKENYFPAVLEIFRKLINTNNTILRYIYLYQRA